VISHFPTLGSRVLAGLNELCLPPQSFQALKKKKTLVLFFETGYRYVAEVGLELAM
jgi:hypothetical protein